MHFLKPVSRSDQNDSTGARLQSEHELLLCVARVAMDRETAGRARTLLEGKIDWARLIAGAYRHGLGPLLYHHLRTEFAELIPTPILLELRERFVSNSARNLLLTTELLRLLALFDEHGIAAVPFKGPVLAESVYGDLTLRTFEDLDILIRDTEIAKAESILQEQGYKAALEVPESRLAAFRQTQYEIPYRHKGTSICVELHWKIAPAFFPFSIDMEEAWTRIGWSSLAGGRVRNLSAEDSLLFLCAHGSRHSWEKLEWIVGVAELIRANPEMNWAWVNEQARDPRRGRVLLLGMRLAHDLLGAELPEEVRDSLRKDSPSGKLAAQARYRLFVDRHRAISLIGYCWHHAGLAARWRDKTRTFLKTLFLPRYHDWIGFELPDQLAFLYYPLRIGRLLLKYF